MLFDSKEKASGKLPDGWDFPPKEIDDPTDKKPSDWVDEKQIRKQCLLIASSVLV